MVRRASVENGRPATLQSPQTPEGSAAEVTKERIAFTLLDLAAKLDAQERKFRLSIREAAAAGDLALVQRILDVWDHGPGAEG